MSNDDEVRFYFSFRSPYAWVAFHLLPKAIASRSIAVRPIPVFPPPTYPNDPAAVPAKLEYMLFHDVPRAARKAGLPYKPPSSGADPSWMEPHAMWVYAADQGKGQAFGEALYAKRWSEGRDLGDPTVCAEAAREVGLDPEATVAAGTDEAYQTRVMEGMIGSVQDGVFGVPHFVYRGERFWGHDRIPDLIAAIDQADAA